MMAGLLDDFTSFIKTPEGQGLLSGVFGYAANAQRGTPLNNLGRGGMAGLIGYGNAQEQQQTGKYRQMLMDKTQYELDAAKQAAEKSARIQAALQSAFAPVSGTQAISADDGSGRVGPTPGRATLVGQQNPQPNYQSLIAMGVPVETVKALAESKDYGRQKVARTVKGMGADGREYEYQVDEFGQRVGEGLAQYRAPIASDLGGKQVYLDPYKLTEVAGFNKTMTPGERASNAVAWANNANSRERLAFDKQQASNPAYKWNSDIGAYVNEKTLQTADARDSSGRPVAGGGKPLTEGQSKANLFGTRAQESNKVLEQLATSGVDRPGWIKRTGEGVVGILPSWAGGDGLANAAGAALNWTQSDKQQQAEQAQRDFINAVMRRESGAVIGKDEFVNAQKQYFPMVGDSPAVIEQKARNRKIAIQGIEAEIPGGFRTGKGTSGTSGGWDATGKKSTMSSGGWSAQEVR